jgi:1-acyl-sn-glycerol-3-phosphate acyltransferase
LHKIHSLFTFLSYSPLEQRGENYAKALRRQVRWGCSIHTAIQRCGARNGRKMHYLTPDRLHGIGAWVYGGYAWIILILVVLVFGGLAILFRKPSKGRRIARFGTRLLCRLAGMPLSVKGLDNLPSRPHILVVNHTSFLDGIALTALLPASPGYAFAVRQQYSSQRLLCPLLRSLGTVVLHRFGAPHHTSDIDRLTAALRRGSNLVIFPEGTVGSEPGLKPFHSGAFVAAAKANAPIVVAGLRGVRTALRLGSWLPRRADITLEIGPVLTPHGTDPAALAQLSAAARSAMLPLTGEPDAAAPRAAGGITG